LLCSVLQVDMC